MPEERFEALVDELRERFEALVDELRGEPIVTVPGAGAGFGAGAQRVDNKIFAMLVQGRSS